VETGYRLPFLPSSTTPLRKHDVFLPNHIKPSQEDSPWVTRQLALMLHAGVIRKRRPLDRGATFSPMFVVDKAGGSGRRLIIDMRSLNSELEQIPFSLAPAMLHRNRDILSKANGLFVLDFTSSFQHVEIHVDHQRHFGIAWCGEEYLMTCAPYGCSSVPEMFQTVASIFRAVAVKVGLSPTLTSPDSWERAITDDSSMDLPGSSFPPASHFPIETRQYLDDTWGPTFPTVTSLSRASLNTAESAALTPLLIRSLEALAKCFGWTISPKSHLDHTDPDNIVLGFHVRFPPDGEPYFQIPAAKITRYHDTLAHLLQAPSWSALQVAKVLGQINHLWLVWLDLTAIVSRPLYDFVAEQAGKWNTRVIPTHTQRETLVLAMSALQGQNPTIRSPVKPVSLDIAEQLAVSGTTTVPATQMFTDASDHATGMFLTERPRDEALRARRYTIFQHGRGSRAAWKMLLDPQFDESSTYRELQAILDAYSDEILKSLGRSSRPLVHNIDSQAAWHILHSGSSRSPRCHSLAVRIFFRLAPLRVIRPVVFCWIPRELNQAADFVSKGAHDYRVAPALFLALDSVLHFTLDLFASESERVKGHQGLVPFASFFQSDSSLGDGRRVPFASNGTTWVFPPHGLASLALRRCKQSDSPSALLLPCWRAHPSNRASNDGRKYSIPDGRTAVARADVFGHSAQFIRIPPGFASKRLSSLDSAGNSRTERCRHAMRLVLFNISAEHAAKCSALLASLPPCIGR